MNKTLNTSKGEVKLVYSKNPTTCIDCYHVYNSNNKYIGQCDTLETDEEIVEQIENYLL